MTTTTPHPEPQRPRSALLIIDVQQELDGFGAYVDDRVCEIVARPAHEVAFELERDVPSSTERRSR